MGFLKNLVNKIFAPPKAESKEVTLAKLEDELKNADLDYRFAQLFTHSGGYFNYCQDEVEALHILNKIVKVEGIKSVFCWDEDLKKFLNAINVPYTEKLELFNDTAFITCEHLIAYDGKIMLSHNNILHYHSSRLPKKIIIMATVSQIVNNLNDAMMLVKRRDGKNPLRNLTSISGKNASVDFEDKENLKLFVLLLED